MRSYYASAALLSDIALAQFESGDAEGAGETFLKASETLDKSSSTPIGRSVSLEILARMAKAGHMSQALVRVKEVYDKAKRNGESDAGQWRDLGYSFIAKGAREAVLNGRARIWDFAGAVSGAHEIASPPIRAVILASIAALLYKKGQ